MTRSTISNREILEAALIGLLHQQRTINENIAAIRRQLGIRDGASVPAPAVVLGQPQRKRRKMSAAARKRISEATKKRWAAFRRAKV